MPTREETHLERAGRVPPASCKCAGCAGLAKRYKSDPDLLAFYRRKLLQHGCVGNADDVEKAYQQSHAPWAKAAAERGRQLAQSGGLQERLRRARVAKDQEASAAKDEETATLTPGASPQNTQMPLFP